MRYLTLLLLLFTFSAQATERLPANDERLKQDPYSDNKVVSVDDYVIMASLDKLTYSMEYDRTGKGIAQLMEQTVNNMVVEGTNQLYAHGYKDVADRYIHEFESFKSQIANSYDLGDHEPWSQWLVKFYADLVKYLGQDLVNFLHLDDINIINFALPVVWHPKLYDIDEYRKHFVPLAGSLTYWSAYIACSVITYGQGAIFLICTPIGTVCEKVMVIHIAPGLSDRIWHRING